VLSIAIYDRVEQLDYRAAHLYSLGLVAFSLVVLVRCMPRGAPAAGRAVTRLSASITLSREGFGLEVAFDWRRAA